MTGVITLGELKSVLNDLENSRLGQCLCYLMLCFNCNFDIFGNCKVFWIPKWLLRHMIIWWKDPCAMKEPVAPRTTGRWHWPLTLWRPWTDNIYTCIYLWPMHLCQFVYFVMCLLFWLPMSVLCLLCSLCTLCSCWYFHCFLGLYYIYLYFSLVTLALQCFLCLLPPAFFLFICFFWPFNGFIDRTAEDYDRKQDEREGEWNAAKGTKAGTRTQGHHSEDIFLCKRDSHSTNLAKWHPYATSLFVSCILPFVFYIICIIIKSDFLFNYLPECFVLECLVMSTWYLGAQRSVISACCHKLFA